MTCYRRAGTLQQRRMASAALVLFFWTVVSKDVSKVMWGYLTYLAMQQQLLLLPLLLGVAGQGEGKQQRHQQQQQQQKGNSSSKQVKTPAVIRKTTILLAMLAVHETNVSETDEPYCSLFK